MLRTAAGASWSCQGSAQTTREVAEPADWLERVVVGEVPLSRTAQVADATVCNADVPTDDRWRAAGWLTFVEPTTPFAVGSQAGEQVELLVAFRQQAAGVPIDAYRPTQSQIAIATTTQHVHGAVGALRVQLVAYPTR